MASAGIGFVFPGQGSQSVGMGRAFHEADASIRRLYEEASSVLGYDIAALCFEGPAERLNATQFTQPALLVTSVAAWTVMAPAAPAAVAVAGHSLGEYSAICAAGGLSFTSAVSIVQKRGQYMSEAVPPGSGLVAALIGLDPETVTEVCRNASASGVVAAANFNSPGQVVIAGEKRAVEQAIGGAKAKGCRKAIPLPVSVPVHTPLMQGAAERLAKEFDSVNWTDLRVPLVNNAEAAVIRTAEDIRASLIRQLPSSVRWEQSIKTMAKLGVTTFVEVGPGTVLTGLIKRILPDARTLNVQDPASLDATMKALAH